MRPTWARGARSHRSLASSLRTASRPPPDLVVQSTEWSGLEGHTFCRFHLLPCIQSHPKQSFTDACPRSAWRLDGWWARAGNVVCFARGGWIRGGFYSRLTSRRTGDSPVL